MTGFGIGGVGAEPVSDAAQAGVNKLSHSLTLSVISTAVLLPWVVVLLASSPLWVAPLFVAMLSIMCGIGYLVLRITFRLEQHPFLFLLIPGAGYIAEGAIIAFGVRAGLPSAAMFWACASVGVLGLVLAAFRIKQAGMLRRPVTGGYRYILLSAIICGIYFVPPAFREAVLLPDGTFQWMYADTQYHMALATSVKIAEGRPQMPGMDGAELKYHFAPYAISGALSSALPVPISQSYARILRGLAQFVMMISALGLGFVIVQLSGLPSAAAIGSPILLFFYGSLSALLTPFSNSATAFTSAVLYSVPQLAVPSDGGPFEHILLGHSSVHSSIGLALVLSIAASLVAPKRSTLRALPVGAVLMPGIVAALNSVTGAAGAGLIAVAAVIRGPMAFRNWVLALMTLCGAAAAFAAMGYLGSAMDKMVIDTRMYEEFPRIAVWAIIGLGARGILFSPAIARYPFGIRVLLVLLLLGFLGFTVVFKDIWWGNDRYGVIFLQCSLSMLAGPLVMSCLSPVPDKTAAARKTAKFLLQGTKRIAVLFAVAALIGLITVFEYGQPANTGLNYAYWFKLVLTIALAATVGSAIGSYLLAARSRMGDVVARVVLVVYAIGFLAWVPGWLDFGLDRAHLAVRQPPVVVAGLLKLRSLAGQESIIATNDDSVATIPSRPERSYGYYALAERPVLLEGWQYGEKLHPRFPIIHRDNTVLFKTRDPAEFWGIVKRYGIDYIVAKPGTDIALPIPHPSWLRRLPTPGLVIYNVVNQ
ncbi:hypothetical protein [Petrachloros mirabilis]